MRPAHAARSAGVKTRRANRSPCSASSRRSAAVSTMSRPMPRITVLPAQHAAAVDVQYLTGDMAGQARAQKDNGTRYILGTGHPPQRNRLLDRRTAPPAYGLDDISVSTHPGATQLIVILGASSTASDLVIEMTAPFVAA